MRTTDPEAALHFIGAARLPEPRSRSRGSPDSKTVLDALETTRQQAAVVGAEVVAFAEGVPGAFRQDLVNSTMLAQLVATK